VASRETTFQEFSGTTGRPISNDFEKKKQDTLLPSRRKRYLSRVKSLYVSNVRDVMAFRLGAEETVMLSHHDSRGFVVHLFRRVDPIAYSICDLRQLSFSPTK
jgi:hypothetical protein